MNLLKAFKITTGQMPPSFLRIRSQPGEVPVSSLLPFKPVLVFLLKSSSPAPQKTPSLQVLLFALELLLVGDKIPALSVIPTSLVL